MTNLRAAIGGLVLLAVATMAVAQRPGSTESELNYARQFMEAGEWDYAMWRYEGILRLDPGNAEAKAGYAKARAAYEAKQARLAAPARAFSAPARNQSVPVVRRRSSGAATHGPSAGSKAKNMCDAQFGTCYTIYHSIPQCAVKRTMCYTQNHVK